MDTASKSNKAHLGSAPDGISIGNAASDKVALHGATPIIQASLTALTENAGVIGGTNDKDLPDLAATYVARTSNGGGTADGAYEDELSVSTAGGNTYSDSVVNAVTGKLKNNVRELATVVAQLAADNVALRAAIRESAAQCNNLRTVLVNKGILA